METMNKNLTEMRKGFDQVNELKKAMQARIDEEFV